MRKRSSFPETSCATFFATRSNQTGYFPVAGRWRLTCYVHARKARRSLPSPDIVFTPSQKLEMVGPPTRSAALSISCGHIAEWHVDLRKPKGGSDIGKAGLSWEDGTWQPFPHRQGGPRCVILTEVPFAIR